MLFTRSMLAVALLALTCVLASPLPLPLRKASRQVQVVSFIKGDSVELAQVKRDLWASSEGPVVEKRQEINDVPDQSPTKSDGGAIVPFNSRIKRQEINDVPDQSPTKSDGGAIVPFNSRIKRQEINDVPDQSPTKSDGGAIVPFNSRIKRQEINDVPDQSPTKSDGGAIVPFNSKRSIDDAQAEYAVQLGSNKRAVDTFPAHLAARSDGDAVLAF